MKCKHRWTEWHADPLYENLESRWCRAARHRDWCTHVEYRLSPAGVGLWLVALCAVDSQVEGDLDAHLFLMDWTDSIVEGVWK